MQLVMRHDSMRIASHCFLATARSCIKHLIERYDPDMAFMPYLVPEGLIMPFEKSNVPVHRYQLQADFSPNEHDLWAQVSMMKPKRPLVVVVAYFGYPIPTRQAAAIAHEVGGLCLEDRAHCLATYNESDVESCSDIKLYSLNKILPVTDGAMIFSRSSDANLDMSTIKLPHLDAKALSAYADHLAANRIMQASKEADMWFALAAERSKVMYEAYYEHISENMEPRQPTVAASSVAGTIEFGDVVKKRKACAETIIKHLRKEQLFRHDAPVMCLPIRTGRPGNALDELLKRGICGAQINNHWRLPPGGAELDFWLNHVLLPVNETMSADEAAEIGKVASWLS